LFIKSLYKMKEDFVFLPFSVLHIHNVNFEYNRFFTHSHIKFGGKIIQCNSVMYKLSNGNSF
jgi:hypothetical protein